MKQWTLLMVLLATAIVCAQTWEPTQMTGTIPSDRYGHTMVKIGDAYYLFGGTTASKGFSSEVFKLQGNNFTKIDVSGTVPGMTGHNATINGTKMVIVGGSRDSSDNSVYAIDPTASNPTWEVKSEQPFTARKESASIIVGTNLIVTGGRSVDESTVYPDTWVCDLNSNTWRKGYDMPWGGRYGHTLALKDNVVYVLGGKNPDGDDVFAVFTYETQYGSWDIGSTQGTSPLPRSFCINGQDGSELIIAGGLSNASTTLTETATVNRTASRNANVDLGDVWKLDMSTTPPTWTAVPVEGTEKPVFSHSAGYVTITDNNGKQNVQVMALGGLKGEVIQSLGEVWQYNSSEPPQPVVKDITVNLSVLGRIRYAIHFMTFEELQEKVTVTLTWQDNAKIRMCALYIPWLIRDQHHVARYEDDPDESQEKECLAKLLSSKENAESSTGKIEKTFKNVKRGTLVLLVMNASVKTAQNLNLKVADFTNTPSRYTLIFPIGKPEIFSNANAGNLVNTVTFPVAPVRWNSRYPKCAKEYITETPTQGTNSWTWTCVDKNKRLILVPGYVKFYLP